MDLGPSCPAGARPVAADEFCAQEVETSGGACGWEPRMQVTQDVEGRNDAINAPIDILIQMTHPLNNYNILAHPIALGLTADSWNAT